jgi:catalase
MAMVNPKGRVNYEPNSWGAGPRESPEIGFRSFPAPESGEKLRIRAETFADHYSQARQFYISQTDVEQQHIADALTFELSKCQRVDIRERMVAHLLNIDQTLAQKVAQGLRVREMPKPAAAARPTLQHHKPSPALSILKNPPPNFAGRRVGALVTDGVDAKLLQALAKAVKKEQAMLMLVAPEVGGVEASDGTWHEADEKLEGGPSVLFDAVALLPSAEGASQLLKRPAARDFVADAVAHQKFIAFSKAAQPLLEKAGAPSPDGGMIPLQQPKDCETFVQRCREVRFWKREP